MDIEFRIMSVLVFLPAIVVRLHYYHRTKEFIKTTTKTEGIINGLLMKLTLAIGQLFALLYILGIPWLFQFSLEFPFLMKWFGLSLLALSSVLLVWIHIELGTNFSRSLKIKNRHKLITTGPYRMVRHPMYSAFIMMWVGFFLLSCNSIIGLSSLLYLTIIVFRIPKEERMLQEYFQKEYYRYIQYTGRLLPKLGKII